MLGMAHDGNILDRLVGCAISKSEAGTGSYNLDIQTAYADTLPYLVKVRPD